MTDVAEHEDTAGETTPPPPTERVAEPPTEPPAVPPGDLDQRGRDRRWFLRGTLGVSGVMALLVAGSAVPVLNPISILKWRNPKDSPNGIPINRTASAAGVTMKPEEAWRVTVKGPTGTKSLSSADFAALTQVTVTLPISCVEGWSASAEWTGVRVSDVMALVGGTDSDVLFGSAEKSGGYRSSTLPAVYAAQPNALLAFTINGERLPLDHGYPARLIAPNRPGEVQTKWVATMEAVTA